MKQSWILFSISRVDGPKKKFKEVVIISGVVENKERTT